jgi:hypothetical protein
VTPVDDTAADLLSDRPIRPLAPPAPPRLVVAPPLVPGVVAFPPMPDAHTGPIQRVEEVFDQEAQEAQQPPAPLPSALRPAVLHDDPPAPRVDLPSVRGTVEFDDTARLDFDAPPLPLGIVDADGRPEPAPARRPRRETSDEDRAARARIPSWDDILLGVRRKTD